MAFHPCWGGSLKTGVKVIAGIQIGIHTIAFVLFSLAFLIYTWPQIFAHREANNDTTPNSLRSGHELRTNWIGKHVGFHTEHYIVQDQQMYINSEYLKHHTPRILVMLKIFAVYSILLALELWEGANQRNYWRCHVWFRFSLAHFVLCLTVIPFMYLLEVKSYSFTHKDSDQQTRFQLCLSLFYVVTLFISMYFIWVVRSFMIELRREALPTYQKQVDEKI